MNMVPIIVMDADAIIAQVKLDDIHNPTAMKISGKLLETDALLLYPSTCIAESVTHIQRVFNNNATAYGAAITILHDCTITAVDKDILDIAVNYFSPKDSKKNTLFDCIVAATAKKYNADAIFSFDKFYKKLGFKLASEL